jgi:TPR repeat protein
MVCRLIRAVAIVAILLSLGGANVWAGLKDASEALRNRSYDTVLREFRSLAEQGDVGGQFLLGQMYYFGLGVPVDFVRAFMWFTIAASNPAHPRAGSVNKVLYALAEQMTQAEIDEAARLAREWMEKHRKK